MENYFIIKVMTLRVTIIVWSIPDGIKPIFDGVGKKDRGYFRLEGRHDGIEQKFHAFAGQKMLNYGFVYTVIDEKSAERNTKIGTSVFR